MADFILQAGKFFGRKGRGNSRKAFCRRGGILPFQEPAEPEGLEGDQDGHAHLIQFFHIMLQVDEISHLIVKAALTAEGNMQGIIFMDGVFAV